MKISSAEAFVGIQSQDDVESMNLYNITRAVIHPEYDVPSESFNNDIALLRVSDS